MWRAVLGAAIVSSIVAFAAVGPALANLRATCSTQVRSASEAIAIEGLEGSAMHLHGGPPAWLGGAAFRVTNAGSEPVELTVDRIEYLRGRSCHGAPTEVRSEPAFGGLFAAGLGMTESARSLTIEPGATVDLDVGFAAVEAYYVHCDRFAFRVTFRAGEETLIAVAETHVTRVEPMR